MCSDRLLEDGDENFFLPRRLTGEVSLPKAAAVEVALRRVMIDERRMLRYLLLLDLGVVVDYVGLDADSRFMSSFWSILCACSS